MQSELESALRIRSLLNQGVAALGSDTTDRLRAARQKALDRARPAAGFHLLAVGGVRFGTHGLGRSFSMALGLTAIALIVLASFDLNGLRKADEFADIDSALLSDELPPEAYLDKGFYEWLDRSSSPSVRTAARTEASDEPMQ